MPAFAVTVTASYDAVNSAEGALARLHDWAKDEDGRTFVEDRSIGPVRWTASADYVVEAASAQDAERTARGQFLAEAEVAGIETPETVLAASGPIR